MEIGTAESVSRGCFVFKGKKNVANMKDFFCPTDKSKSDKNRLKLYKSTWEDISSQIEDIQSGLNSNMFQDLLDFIKTSATRLSTQKHSSGMSIKEIPTAALLTGVNTSDHGTMFTNFTTQLRDVVTPHVAVLQSRQCVQLKSILSHTISQLTQTNVNSFSDDEDEEEVETKISANMADLALWYNAKYTLKKSPIKKSPNKKRRSNDDANPRPALVIVLEDLEGFPPRVLQDFIIICSNYITQLPIVLVFGIATTINTIHTLLSSSVSSLLSIDKFSALASSHHLSQLIEKILLTSDCPFKLGPRVFQLLLDIFLYHDFSVVNFVTALKMSMLDHFSTQPASLLCCHLSVAMETLETFANTDLDYVRRLPSFMKFVEKQPKDSQFKLLLNDKYTKTVISQHLQSLEDFHISYYPMLRCLHALTHRLPRSPLGKQLRELYAMSLECHIVTTEAYSEAVSLIKCLSKDELISSLERVKVVIDDQLTESVTVMGDLQECLDVSLHSLHNIDSIEMVEDDKTNDQSPTTALPKKTDLHNLRKTLSDMKKNKTQSPYETLRSDIIHKLSSFFEDYLAPPSTLTLHEVYYYDSITTIKQYFYPAPRSSLQTALSNPHHYLQCLCCESDPGLILPSMPDVCIVYKLHLECGRFINLYDWLQAFTTVVNEDEANSIPDDILQARFIRAVSELQFLGFIKATKRKTDHVARLTWGGC